MTDWNQEQAEEALHRFCKMVPELDANPNFVLAVVLSNGVYVPVVFLEEDRDGNNIPDKHLAVLKREGGFKIQWEGFFILLGVGIPAQWLPYNVPEAELDEKILFVWEKWFAMTNRALPL